MDDAYKDLRQQADRIFYQFSDRLDDKSAGAGLAREVRMIVEEFEQNKAPRTIEARIVSLQRQLKHLSETVMDHRDSDEIHDKYEDLRQDMRKLPNY